MTQSTSGPFALALGYGLDGSTLAAIAHAESEIFTLALGRDFDAANTASLASATSAYFILDLERLQEGFASSPAFRLDTSVSIALPAPGDFWITGKANTVQVAWSPLYPRIDKLSISISTDGGLKWRTLKTGVTATVGTWSGEVDPGENGQNARIRLDHFDSAGLGLGFSESANFVVANRDPTKLCVTRNGALVRQAPIFFWNAMSGATGYILEIESVLKTACTPFEQHFDLGPTPAWHQLNADIWRQMPAARYKVRVRKSNDFFPHTYQDLGEFVRFKLDDEDPAASPNAPPVILVHGWTSDNSTWFQNCLATNAKSALLSDLRSSPNGKPLHAWAFEYPNVGPIRHSAAGLRAAVEYLRDQYPSPPQVRLVAHSMGGLVCRTYLQGFAVSPADGPDYGYCANAQPVTTVSHLATLSSPLMGMGEEVIKKAALLHRAKGCWGAPDGHSINDLSDAGSLAADLQCAALPATTRYFFTGGFDGSAYKAGVTGAILYLDCSVGNDGVVDLCSARGDCGGKHEVDPIYIDPQATVYSDQFNLSHDDMSVPGSAGWCRGETYHAYGDHRVGESNRLKTALFNFLTSPPGAPSEHDCLSVDDRLVKHRVKAGGGGGGSWMTASREIQLAAKTPSATSTAPGDPITGALVRIARSDLPEDAGGLWLSTDANGEVAIGLRPGEYLVSVRAKGYAGHADTLVVDPAGAEIIRGLSLEPSPTYQGPRHPYLSVNNGAAVTTDSVVALSLACDGASEYMASDSVGFAGAQWLPLTGQVQFALRGGRGAYVVRAKFRDGAGVESDSASALVEYTSSDFGAVHVDAEPVEGEVVVDGIGTGKMTPATIESLSVGYHQIAVHAPGRRAAPALSVVLVDAGELNTVSFVLTASSPPSPAVWISPARGGFLASGSLFVWGRSTDVDPGDAVFYDLSITDPASASPIWSASGLSGNSQSVPATLRDSVTYVAMARAIDGHLTLQSAPPETLSFTIDRTPPNLRMIFPTEETSVLIGTIAGMRWAAEDFSGLDSLSGYLSRDGGATYPETLFQGEPNDSVAEWSVSGPASQTAWIRIVGYDRAGNATTVSRGPFRISTATGVSEAASIPKIFAFHPNLPNPFNPTTRFGYDLPLGSRVTLRVFDIFGRLVKVLVDAHKPTGRYSVVWDGTGSSGAPAASGVYFAQFTGGAFEKTRKVVLMK